MIYIIRPQGSPHCKIGYAADIAARMVEIQCGNPLPLFIDAQREGDVLLEKAIHVACRPYHVRAEWFTFRPELVELFHGTPAPKRVHTAIVRRAGTTSEVAKWLGVSTHNVHSWAARDSIPAWFWKAFAEAGHATLDELADAAARRAA